MSLFEAAAEGDIAQVQKLLQKGQQDIKQKDAKGWTALHFAARYGHADLVNILLAAGSDPGAANNEGRTPAEMASFWGHNAVAEQIAKKAGKKLPPKPTISLGGNKGAAVGAKVGGSPLISLKGGPKPDPKEQNRGVATKAPSGPMIRVGEPHVNFFSGNPLKRMSEKRANRELITSFMKHPSARFILFNNLSPLFMPSVKGRPFELAYHSFKDVEGIIAPDAKTGKQWVFLGADRDDPVVGEDGADLGRPYFCVDLTPDEDSTKATCQKIIKDAENRGQKFNNFRPGAFRLKPRDAAIVGEARSILDWNLKNPFCSACGRKTWSEDAGFRRSCAPAAAGEKPCMAHKGVQNFCHPRTDPVIIVALASPDGSKLMLGRGKTWQKGFFSCIAGFMEPGESIEDTVRREAMEEIGVKVDKIIYHSSQPWPMPGQLMMGVIATCQEGSTEFNPEEDELEEARWFSREEILAALAISAENDARTQGPPKPKEKPKVDFYLPPSYAIAHQIIRAWANGDVDLGSAPSAKL